MSATDSTPAAEGEHRSPDAQHRHQVTARTAPGKLVRSVWRLHFYAAVLSAPVLALLSVTGLVILYTDPIESAIAGRLVDVEPHGAQVPLESQRAAAAAAQPSMHLAWVTTPKTPHNSTVFTMTADDATYRDVYVNPYTARVLGSRANGGDVVGLANRLHGSLDLPGPTLRLPSAAHLVDPSAEAFVSVNLGDVVVEVCAVWGLVLALSGVYLWWPRRSQKGKALLRPRWSKGGRLRWRDLHASAGILGAGLVVLFVTTGMPWSAYWGPAWSSAAGKITPSQDFSSLASSVPKAGALDRFGHRIPWASREEPVPASEPNTARVTPATPATPLDLTAVARIAAAEHLGPGWTLFPPTDQAAHGTTTYGTYQLSTTWPNRTQRERVVYVDQFSGRTLARSSWHTWGGLKTATEFGVQNHMGTQFGLATRILMTGGCLLLLTSIGTSLVMWWKRRPRGALGLPRRPASPRLPKALVALGLLVGVCYPLWAASAILVVAVDHLLVRRVGALRRVFRMADAGR